MPVPTLARRCAAAIALLLLALAVAACGPEPTPTPPASEQQTADPATILEQACASLLVLDHDMTLILNFRSRENVGFHQYSEGDYATAINYYEDGEPVTHLEEVFVDGVVYRRMSMESPPVFSDWGILPEPSKHPTAVCSPAGAPSGETNALRWYPTARLLEWSIPAPASAPEWEKTSYSYRLWVDDQGRPKRGELVATMPPSVGTEEAETATVTETYSGYGEPNAITAPLVEK